MTRAIVVLKLMVLVVVFSTVLIAMLNLLSSAGWAEQSSVVIRYFSTLPYLVALAFIHFTIEMQCERAFDDREE